MLAYLGIWVGSGAAAAVSAWTASSLPGFAPAPLLGVAAALAAPWYVLSLPLAWYGGFLLPHRFNLSNQSLLLWISDQSKGLVLGAGIGVPLLLALYAVMGRWPETWWLVAAIGYMGFVVLMSAIAPVVLMPLFFKFRPLGDDRKDLVARLARLARSRGPEVRGVFTFDMSRRTQGANAALVGIGRTRRILLGDTLLSAFTDDEIETVVAHELGHHVHRDLPRSIAVQSILTVASLGVTAALSQFVRGGQLGAPSDPVGLPVLALVLSLTGLALLPIQNAVSRWSESQADAFALRASDHPEAFADALTRLANQNLADVDPPRWSVVLLGSHPPLRERIERAQRAGLAVGDPAQ
jgi:STE24 endopeptidase